MSSLFYTLGYYIGFFSIMIIFMIIAIVTAKSKLAWAWYGIGAPIQLFPLFGGYLNGSTTTLDWFVYFGLLLITALVICIRYKKANDCKEENAEIEEQEYINNTCSIQTKTNEPQKTKVTNKSGLIIVIAALALLAITLVALLVGKIVDYNNNFNSGSTSDVLRVGVSADFPPYEYIDNSNKFAGIEVEMVAAIAEELDLQVEFFNIDFNSLFTALTEGTVDCIMGGMEYTPQRQEIANVSNSMFTDTDGFNSVIYIEKSNIDLQTAINKAINKFQKNGTFDKILAKYQDFDYSNVNSEFYESDDLSSSNTTTTTKAPTTTTTKTPTTTTKKPTTTTSSKTEKTCLSVGCNNQPKSLSSYCGEHACSKKWMRLREV